MSTNRNDRSAPPRRTGRELIGPRSCRVRGLCLALVGLALAGCRHEMYDQPRYEPLEASDFFEDGKSARNPEPGTVARGEKRADTHLYEGLVGGKEADALPPSLEFNRALLERGQQRYRIYCTPCHGELGDGHGMIVQRGFTPPPPFYGQFVAKDVQSPSPGAPTYKDLREAPLGHFYRVITNGHGAMYSYASRIPVEDRWKIAAYIRALQLSQSATADQLKGIANPTVKERELIREATR